MARTNEQAVRLIMETSLDSYSIKAFIDDASLWVDNNLVGEGLSDETLTAIEKYLAAAFATSKEPRLRDRSMKSVKETFQVDPSVSEYMKRAADLDPTGIVGGAFLPSKRKGIIRIGAGFDDDHPSAGI